MLRMTFLGLAFGGALVVTASQASAQQYMTTRQVASGLSRPVYVTAPPGDTSRLFIVEQRGSGGVSNRADIRILDLNTNPPTLLATPFLSITGVSTSSEQGLLGLAFHPDYANNRTFFVYYTNPSTQIVRYKASTTNPNIADSASATTILSFSQPASNHNGGWIGFGPDGYLYIATGDGGGAGDTANNAQNLNTLLGKMLRIAVSDSGTYTIPPGNPFPQANAPFNTIWSYGLRNPWRASFDRQTGQMYIGDVGQNAWEEVNIEPPNTPGRNYGWRCYEANAAFNTTGCGSASNYVFPVHAYPLNSGRCAVMGGYVYRGSAIPEMQGHYLFGDYCASQFYSFQYTGTNNPPVVNRTTELAPGGGISITNPTSFGEDANGELYITALSGGRVFQVIPRPPINDTCAEALNVTNSIAFSTVAATTTGPNEPGACNFNGHSNVDNDVWFKYLAPCNGNVTVSVCGANFNTKIAVYGPCPVGSGEAIACNDDFCGTASQVTFAATQGTIYRIRVGGFQGATGSGTVNVNCVVPSNCPGDITGDSQVNVNDLLAVINAWGPCPAPPASCPPDISPPGGDGVVNVNDLLLVINSWGPCPPSR